MIWSPIILSLKLAFVTTLVLYLIGIPLTFVQSEKRGWYSPFLDALFSLPLVLPPTVLGFYLLVLLSPQSTLGQFLSNTLGIQLIFSFQGLVIGSVIYSLPFMLQPLSNGMDSLSPQLRESGHLLGYSRWQTFYKLLLPNIKPALLTGGILAFAHTLGEFGVVLMIGGNIPDETRVASVAIYEEVEAMRYSSAHLYSAVLLSLAFTLLLIARFSAKKLNRQWA